MSARKGAEVSAVFPSTVMTLRLRLDPPWIFAARTAYWRHKADVTLCLAASWHVACEPTYAYGLRTARRSLQCLSRVIISRVHSMKRFLSRLSTQCVLTSILALGLGVPALSSAQSSSDRTGSGTPSTSPAAAVEHGAMTSSMSGSADMHKSMMDSMKDMQSMPMTGDVDRDFAMMMRQHHKSGVEMARHEVEHGKDAKMRAMAKKIMAAQQKEVKEFDRWLDSHPKGAASKR